MLCCAVLCCVVLLGVLYGRHDCHDGGQPRSCIQLGSAEGDVAPSDCCMQLSEGSVLKIPPCSFLASSLHVHGRCLRATLHPRAAHGQTLRLWTTPSPRCFDWCVGCDALWAVVEWLWACALVGCGLWAVGCGLWAVGCGLWAVGLWASGLVGLWASGLVGWWAVSLPCFVPPLASIVLCCVGRWW